MQTCRRIVVLLVAFLAAAALATGCSSKKAEPLPEAGPLTQQSIAATKALKSAHLEIAVTGKIEGLPLKALSGNLTNVPSTAFQGNAKVVMGGADVDADLIVLDGTLYAALTPNNWLDMGPAADVYDPSVVLNPSSGLAGLLGSLTDAKADGLETVGGVPTVRITGNVSADSVHKLIPQVKGSSPMPATVWIEKDEPHQLVQSKVDQSEGNSIALTLSDWDKPVTVTKPAV